MSWDKTKAHLMHHGALKSGTVAAKTQRGEMTQRQSNTKNESEGTGFMALFSPRWRRCSEGYDVTAQAYASASPEEIARAVVLHRYGGWLNDDLVVDENLQALSKGGLVKSRRQTATNQELWVATWFEPHFDVAAPSTLVATAEELNDLTRWRLPPVGDKVAYEK